MNHLTSLFMLVMGIGIIAVAVQGVVRGWLPNGPKGFQEGEGVSREEQPVGFWFFFLLYVGMGVVASVYALRHL